MKRSDEAERRFDACLDNLLRVTEEGGQGMFLAT